MSSDPVLDTKLKLILARIETLEYMLEKKGIINNEEFKKVFNERFEVLFPTDKSKEKI